MEKLKRFKWILVVLVVLSLVGIMIISVYLLSPPRMLYPEEIRDYEGQNLSSISYFRENSIKGPQQVNESTYRLTLTGLVNQSAQYTYADVILWEGFLLKDLLNEAGISPEAVVVIFYAYDGYSTALPLNYILDNNILIAYKMNGLTLPYERGFPFQLVADG